MRALVLVDARHGLKTSDEAVMAMLAEAAVPFQLVLTKADLVRPAAAAELTGELVDRLPARPAALPTVLATSARSREGLDVLRAELAGLAARQRQGIGSDRRADPRTSTPSPGTLVEALPYMRRYAGCGLRHQIWRPRHGRGASSPATSPATSCC